MKKDTVFSRTWSKLRQMCFILTILEGKLGCPLLFGVKHLEKRCTAQQTVERDTRGGESRMVVLRRVGSAGLARNAEVVGSTPARFQRHTPFFIPDGVNNQLSQCYLKHFLI